MNDVTKPSRLPRALRPFAVGQYRLLTSALVCSMLSIGIWLVASVWQVIQLGGTPSDLSLVALGASLGLVLSVLIGGAVADRIPQRFILLTVEMVRGLGFGAAAILALTDNIAIWQLAVIAFVLGIADGFFFPAYSAWLPALIEPEIASDGLKWFSRTKKRAPFARVRWRTASAKGARRAGADTLMPPLLLLRLPGPAVRRFSGGKGRP